MPGCGSGAVVLPWSSPRLQHHAAGARKIHLSRLFRVPQPALSELAATKAKEFVDSLFKKDRGLSRADLDELVMLCSAAGEALPKRFTKIVSEYERSYTGATVTQKEFLSRLDRVLEVSGEFPDPVYGGKIDLADEIIPTFQLDKKDRLRVMELCSQMRKIVFASADFDHPHKRRLLNRIAAIEAQVEQEKGIFDIVRGGMDDLGETLGKFGKEIKPLTDRMQEVIGIARRNTPEYNQLPPPEEVKQLPSPKDED